MGRTDFQTNPHVAEAVHSFRTSTILALPDLPVTIRHSLDFEQKETTRSPSYGFEYPFAHSGTESSGQIGPSISAGTGVLSVQCDSLANSSNR